MEIEMDTSLENAENIIQFKSKGICSRLSKIRDSVFALAEGTVEVERAFHHQGEIKTKKRNRMKPTNLAEKMKIVIHGNVKPSKEFFKSIWKTFETLKKRHIVAMSGGTTWTDLCNQVLFSLIC